MVFALMELTFGGVLCRGQKLREGARASQHQGSLPLWCPSPHEQVELVMGVYPDVANPALLQKYLSRHPQNSNESTCLEEGVEGQIHCTTQGLLCFPDENHETLFWLLRVQFAEEHWL